MKLHHTEFDGVLMLWCPGCESAHQIHVAPQPIAWEWNGSDDSPTFSPSLLTWGGPSPRCHSFIRAGRIEFLADSEHALVGQTVDLPDWPVA